MSNVPVGAIDPSGMDLVWPGDPGWHEPEPYPVMPVDTNPPLPPLPPWANDPKVHYFQRTSDLCGCGSWPLPHAYVVVYNPDGTTTTYSYDGVWRVNSPNDNADYPAFDMGRMPVTPAEVQKAYQWLKQHEYDEAYNLFTHNCQSEAQQLIELAYNGPPYGPAKPNPWVDLQGPDPFSPLLLPPPGFTVPPEELK